MSRYTKVKILKKIFVVMVMLAISAFQQQKGPSAEHKIKAIFLFNFAQFVVWPEEAFSSPQAPIIIGILGDDPFGSYLNETVKGEKVGTHPLTVKRFSKAEEATESHILFINTSRSDKLSEILPMLKGHHILTVGDTPGFAKTGGIIRFVSENNKIRIRINLDVAKQEELSISSKLLRLAEITSSASN